MVLDFIKKHPGVIVVLQSVGSKGAIPDLCGLRFAGAARMWITRKAHDCIQASILNVLNALWEREQCKQTAVDIGPEALASENERGLVFHILAPLGAVMNKMQRSLHDALHATVQVRKLGPEAHKVIRSGIRTFPFEWFEKKTVGVFVVRLQQDPILDHAVCIDASCGIILDSEEGFPVKLSARALGMCGCDVANRLRVVEVSQLVIFKQHK